LLLMPLGQAIAHMDDVEGLQVHRSWWVARHAVQCSIRDGRNLRLRLTTGLETPVARSKVGMLRSAGWLSSQPAIIAQAPDQ
jgi:DNA-binding LytR/AlgR family response regulator